MHLPPVIYPQFSVRDEIVTPAESLRNLEVILDSQMHQDKPISCYEIVFHLPQGHVPNKILLPPH